MHCMSMDEMASNKDEEADEELLSQLKLFNEINKERSSFRHRFCRVWKSLKLRSALGHAGLMISLSIYCVVGGVVSMSNWLYCRAWRAIFSDYDYYYFMILCCCVFYPHIPYYHCHSSIYVNIICGSVLLCFISIFVGVCCRKNMPKCQY